MNFPLFVEQQGHHRFLFFEFPYFRLELNYCAVSIISTAGGRCALTVYTTMVPDDSWCWPLLIKIISDDSHIHREFGWHSNE